MSRRTFGNVRGPSWAEVILGAVFSLGLGAVLGAVFLALHPIEVVKELPPEAERKAGVVYHLDGSRDVNKARLASTKKKAFLEGQSVTLTEDELNVLAGPAPAPRRPAAKGPAAAKAPAAKPAPSAPSGSGAGADEAALVRGTPNFRLREDDVQISVPVTVNALGLGSVVTVRANGQFVRQGDVFIYEIGDLYVGSLPVHRLPFLCSYAREQFSAQALPEGLGAVWSKVAKVTVGNGSLQLTMP
ncbi:MAG: hypothetical protein Q8N18_27035 [Opitutaceae bacterium]|nr:hypothetical protein [Opitutaceae bacterium]